MSDPAAGPGHNAPAVTVSELSASLKRVVEGEFSRVRVRGEVSGFKRAGSGHLYMALKDDSAVLDAVCWRGTAGRLAVDPEDGLEVIATGKLTTYAGRSKYQIVIEALEAAGEGALLKMLEERRRKLAAEGLFDESRKKPLPFLPSVIGVVTSPTGAVIRDILHRLEDRFPRHVLLWPVRVQGDAAAAEVAGAIEGFNAIRGDAQIPRPDLLIVARGGGSIEDLWPFNEENVVRVAAASEIPLVSAVGHETDTTLIDHAADRRAPTPTAAAEIAVPVRSELVAQILDDGRRLVSAMGRLREEYRLRLESAGRGLPDPQSLLAAKTQQLDDRAERLDLGLRGLVREKRSAADRLAAGIRPAALVQLITRRRDRAADLGARLQPLMGRHLAELNQRMEQRGKLLESFSYNRVLDRGFALVQDRRGQPVTDTAGAQRAGRVIMRFRDGRVSARVEAPDSDAAGMAKGSRSRPKLPPDKDQGTLL
ncbi:MAG: exodeoxyribonuclease VII large subunit [Rhodospirillaceae bacterium]|nr:exodeoxyribonuclease VII large subunit [Rhodospirillaceae bacterium]